MMFTIFWLLVDAFMVFMNYRFAKNEESKGRNGFAMFFTIFTAVWVIFFGFDLYALLKMVLEG